MAQEDERAGRLERLLVQVTGDTKAEGERSRRGLLIVLGLSLIASLVLLFVLMSRDLHGLGAAPSPARTQVGRSALPARAR